MHDNSTSHCSRVARDFLTSSVTCRRHGYRWSLPQVCSQFHATVADPDSCAPLRSETSRCSQWCLTCTRYLLTPVNTCWNLPSRDCSWLNTRLYIRVWRLTVSISSWFSRQRVILLLLQFSASPGLTPLSLSFNEWKCVGKWFRIASYELFDMELWYEWTDKQTTDESKQTNCWK